MGVAISARSQPGCGGSPFPAASSDTIRRAMLRTRRAAAAPLPAVAVAAAASAAKRARIGAAQLVSRAGSSRDTTSSTPAGSNIGDR